MSEVFLELRGIKKSFGGVKALKGIDLTIRKGEIHCLVGENGCGKSTLIKVISGAHAADTGDIIIEGKKYDHLSPMEAIRKGIQVIYQDFSIFPNLTVAENIALNHELEANKKTVDWKQVKKIAREAMDKIGADIAMDVLVERLSIANKQMVAICRALLNDAKLIIMDEPTTALTSKEVTRLFDIIRTLQNNGIAVMIVNHKLDEVYQIGQTLTILRNGENVANGNLNEFDKKRFIKEMTGRNIEEVLYRPENTEEEILRVENLSKEGSLYEISFTLNKNDVLGITGLLGSGRGAIGDALFGIAPMTSGKVILNGKEIQIKSVRDAIKNKIAYVPEDRLTQGLFLEKSIGMNVVVAALKKYLTKSKLNYKAMKNAMNHWIKQLSVKTPSAEPPIKTLSGGNQQKVVLAKWLNMDPEILILNGPTVGVDIGSKTDIHQILHELALKGVGIIVISDDLPELLYNCNKIIIMNSGKLVASMDSKDIKDETHLSNLLSQQTS